MSTPRNCRIVADYATGKTVANLAREHNISATRVEQIVMDLCHKLGMKPEQARDNPVRFLEVLRLYNSHPDYAYIARTPKEFYYEMLAELRTCKY